MKRCEENTYDNCKDMIKAKRRKGLSLLGKAKEKQKRKFPTSIRLEHGRNIWIAEGYSETETLRHRHTAIG